MLYKNKKIHRKRLLLAVLLAVLAGYGTFLFIGSRNNLNVDQKQQQKAEDLDSENAKNEADLNLSDSEMSLKEDGVESTSTPDATISIGNLNFSQANGLINSSVSVIGATSGTCSFTFTDGDGRAITKKTELNGVICSISVSEAEFSMIGRYDLTARFKGLTESLKVDIK
jgi:hypothetical protein